MKERHLVRMVEVIILFGHGKGRKGNRGIDPLDASLSLKADTTACTFCNATVPSNYES